MNKSMLVTGATNGTGFAIAERFASEGYDVFITSREKARAIEAAETLGKKYPNIKAYGFGIVPPDEAPVLELFEKIRTMGYLLDCIVLNAANLGLGMDVLDVKIEDFAEVINTNLIWNFEMARSAARQMKEKGHGSIVFINSNTAYRVIPDRCAYSTSKGGVLALSRTLALDLGKFGIRSNCVLPGMIKTVRWEARKAQNLKPFPSSYTPIGDIAEFTDIANAAWYFGSDQSRNTTGAELVVDGGNMIQLYPIIPENEQ